MGHPGPPLRHKPRAHNLSPPRQLRRAPILPISFGMAFLAQALKPGGEDHHCPADERAAQAHDKEKGNVVHIRS